MSDHLSGLGSSVDQSGASASGDLVGRDKITSVHLSERRTQIDGWLERLAEEQRSDIRVRDVVDNLQYYFQAFPYDDVVGLEAKLVHSGRSDKLLAALKKKESFSKLLAEWQAFPAAQEIIAYFLAHIDLIFESDIAPLLGTATREEVDSYINEKLVKPVLDEMGCGPFMLNHNHVAGMVYWLAEQCYVRWHA